MTVSVPTTARARGPAGPTGQVRLPIQRGAAQTRPPDVPIGHGESVLIRDERYQHLNFALLRFAATSPGDPSRAELRAQLVAGFLPLARNMARRFRQRSEPTEDLEQVASLGLLQALDRFRPEFGRDFFAFAIPTITGELRRHFRDKGWAVRVPRRLKDLYVTMSAATGELTQALGRAPKPSELAYHLDLPIEEVLEGLEACAAYRPDSLDREKFSDRPGEGQETLGDRLGENDPRFALTENLLALRPLLAELPEREHNILLMRFYDDMTQSQIADHLGISQMHVSRLLTQTLTWLRRQLDEPVADAR